MAIFLLPFIAQNEYDLFKHAVGPDLADTYDEWLRLHTEEMNERRLRGETVVEIKLRFREFLLFCGATGRTPNLKNLREFTNEEAARR